MKPPRLIQTLLLALGVAGLPVQAQEPQSPVVLRAVGPHVPDATVAVIAQNAAPFELNEGMRSEFAKLSVEAAIARVCGSFREAYLDALTAANGGLKLSRGEVLGGRANTMVWPACLYVERSEEGFKRQLAPEESRKNIYKEMTGGDGTPSAITKFFKATQAKDLVYGAHRTAPVALTPIGMGPEKFKAIVAQSVREALPGSPVAAFVRASTPPPGEIVLGGTVASSVTKCRKASGPQFDARAVADAFYFAEGRRLALEPRPPNGQVSVTIVDNGFYGADDQDGFDAAFVGSPFLRRFFELNAKTTVARAFKVSTGEELYPLNLRNDVPPDAISGHGTHVTGLALGGPIFQKFLSDWPVAQDPWASVNILNVARGKKELIGGAYLGLQALIPADTRRRIVNMSLTHDGRVDSDAGEAYRALFKKLNETLFVVAAGNTTGDVKDVNELKAFPAALGGTRFDNVLTVAALDGDGGLAPFSNRSSTAVDIAAPGCEIESWISNTAAVLALSGTSQAAPANTFGGSLLWSRDMWASAAAIKQRLIVAGDLLDKPDDVGRIAYGVRLNIPKALLWFDDYLEVTGDEAGRYLGETLKLSKTRCKGTESSNGDPLPNVWAIKRNAATDRLFVGRLTYTLDPPCPMEPDGDGQLVFQANWKITSTGFQVLSPPMTMVKRLDQVTELVIRPVSRSN